jgi:hypothetical protein
LDLKTILLINVLFLCGCKHNSHSSSVINSNIPLFNYTLISGLQAGNIISNTTLEDLVRIFGYSKIEILKSDSTILKIFPKTKNEALIFLKRKGNTYKVSIVEFYSLGGKWKTNKGIAIGSILNGFKNDKNMVCFAENDTVTRIVMNFD